MTYTNFQIVSKISLVVMVEIVVLALTAVIDSFEICTINFLIQKNFETNFIMSKALVGVAQPKQNKKKLLLSLKEELGHVNYFFNKIFSFKHEPLFEISILR